MKKVFLSVAFVLPLFMYFSCKGNESNSSLFEKNPVTINWKGSKENVESLCANVKVYSMNNRKNAGFVQKNQYRLSLKTINGISYSRVDFEAEYNGGLPRMALTDGSQMIIANSSTDEVEMRFSLPENKNAFNFDFINSASYTGKVDLDKVRSACKRLSLDITEDEEEKGTMLVKISPELFSSVSTGKVLSTKITFDTCNEVLKETEIVSSEGEGITVITKQTPLYQEVDGEFIKIGCVTEIDTKNENEVDRFNDDYKALPPSEDIPVISKSEYEKMKADGNTVEVINSFEGDLRNLSNKETFVELYDYVSLNDVSDEEFRLLIGGKK